MSAPDGFIDCAELREHVETAAAALAHWAYRDDTKAQPQVRQAANTAIARIDAALRELSRIRTELVGQIRQADDATMVRSEQLLNRIRRERSGLDRMFPGADHLAGGAS